MQVFEIKIEERKAEVTATSVEMAARIAAEMWDTHPRQVVVTYLGEAKEK